MKSHFALGHRAAIACAVSSAAAMIPQVCSAQFAADYATDPAYVSGWSSGANGGYGFSPWVLSGNSATMNSTSPFNQLGMAWTLYNPTAGDLSTATRGFAPLQIGQTISMVFDNPVEIGYWRGFTVGFLSSGTERAAVWQFSAWGGGGNLEGKWQTGVDNHVTPLTATDTSLGVQLDFTLTGADTYALRMTPSGNPLLAITDGGALGSGGDIDQIKFTFYDLQTDPQTPTDFYISSLTIVPEPSTWALLGLGGLFFLRRRK